MNILILFTFIPLIFAASRDCNKKLHTDFYDDNYGKNHVEFFLKETFDNRTTISNVCQQITDQEFRQPYLHYLFYSVDHIIDDHIIDTNPDLGSCNINIKGNLILADSIWISEIKQKCSNHANLEKAQVYKTIYQKALDNVKHCCQIKPSIKPSAQLSEKPSDKPSEMPTTEPSDNSTLDKILTFFKIIGIVLIAICVVFVAAIFIVMFGTVLWDKCCAKKDTILEHDQPLVGTYIDNIDNVNDIDNDDL